MSRTDDMDRWLVTVVGDKHARKLLRVTARSGLSVARVLQVGIELADRALALLPKNLASLSMVDRRMQASTPEARQETARKAAWARWHPPPPPPQAARDPKK